MIENGRIQTFLSVTPACTIAVISLKLLDIDTQIELMRTPICLQDTITSWNFSNNNSLKRLLNQSLEFGFKSNFTYAFFIPQLRFATGVCKQIKLIKFKSNCSGKKITFFGENNQIELNLTKTEPLKKTKLLYKSSFNRVLFIK